MNYLYFADCLDVLEELDREHNGKGFIDLIYIDPPFNSKRNLILWRGNVFYLGIFRTIFYNRQSLLHFQFQRV